MAAEHLTGIARDQLDALQPIGPECGRLLLRLLELNGWDLYERTGFAGEVLVVAERREYPFLRAEARGESLAEVASALVLECNRQVRPPAAA